MAPELQGQYRGDVSKFPKSDVYAYGIIMTNEVMTGEIPFEGMHQHDIQYARCS
jgi:serine/threonine protein kinase